MHKINPDEAQMLTDTVQSYGGFDAEIWSVVVGEGAGRGHPPRSASELPL